MDGHIHLGSTAFPFTFDTGATDTFISMENATAAGEDITCQLTPLKKPFPVSTASASDEGTLTATHKLTIDATIEFLDGARKPVEKLVLYAVPGLTSDTILIGQRTIQRRFNLSIAQLVKDAAATLPPDDEDPDKATCARAAGTIDEDDLPLAVENHDPAVVNPIVASNWTTCATPVFQH